MTTIRPLELDAKQIFNLLLMCKFYYPEFKFQYYNDTNDHQVVHCPEIGCVSFYKELRNNTDHSNQIHWYELCVETLSVKICGNKYSFFEGMMEEKMGVVDYLYHRFKSTK